MNPYRLGTPYNDLPEGWELRPDPEIAGGYIAFATFADGREFALAQAEEGDPRVSVLCPVFYTPAELDGECIATLPDLDAALEYVNPMMEVG